MANERVTAQDVMVENVRTVFAETPAIRAAQIMVRSGIRHLVVVNVEGKVVGVFTQRQVLKHFSPWLGDVNRSAEPAPRCEVREFMSAPPITVTLGTPLREAAGILASRKIGCLPVVKEDGTLAGLLSSVDLLTFVASDDLPVPSEEFERFVPPAFISEEGNINLPKGYVANLKFDTAVLAYAGGSRRIRVKFFLKGKDEESLNGARRVRLTDEHVVIPAKDFLDYHRSTFRGEVDVTEDENAGCFVLSPRIPKLKARAVRSRDHSGFTFRG